MDAIIQRVNSILVWSVQRFDSLPTLPNTSLLSPRFYADSSRTVEFCLKIVADNFPTDCDEYLGDLSLCRCDNDGPENVEVEYEITFATSLEFAISKDEFLKPENGALYPSSESQCLELYKDDMTDDQLIIICEILSCAEKQTDNSEIRDNEDIIELSLAFDDLFENPLFPDATIRIQNREFKVHKAILDARCPGLLEECEAIQSREAYTQYDEYAIQKLLYYIYTGRFECENLPHDLCFLLQKCNKSVFSRLCSSFINIVHAETFFKLNKISCNWVIENFFNFPRDMEFRNKIIDNDPSTWFKISFLTVRDKSEVKEVKFVMSKICQETVTFVLCKINLIDRAGEPTLLYEGSHLFNDERTFQVSLDDKICLIRSKQFDAAVKFNLKLQLTDGVPINSMNTMKSVSEISRPRNRTNLSQLARDIRKLCQNSHHSDIILKINDNRIFAHKAILSTRSSVFRRKFQHSNSETRHTEVSMNDLDEEVALSMIHYIYSAQIVNFNTDLAFELYNAANLYEIPQLKEKCFRHLQSSLNETNVCQILLFADAQNDRELKLFVYGFISSNPDIMLESKELKGTLSSYNDLLLEYLNEHTNMTTGM